MKRTIFVLTTVLFFALSLSSCKKDETNNNGGGGTAAGYVDLGLPSGTKWKSTNETGGTNGFYTYDEAMSVFGDKLPTKKQLEELMDNCTWVWQNNGYKVTGKNGNSIVLPAAGLDPCEGNVQSVGSVGCYWSSTPYYSEFALCLEFYSEEIYIGEAYPCNLLSVRLVQK